MSEDTPNADSNSAVLLVENLDEESAANIAKCNPAFELRRDQIP